MVIRGGVNYCIRNGLPAGISYSRRLERVQKAEKQRKRGRFPRVPYGTQQRQKRGEWFSLVALVIFWALWVYKCLNGGAGMDLVWMAHL